MKSNLIKRTRGVLKIGLPLIALTFTACTDLEIEESDSVFSEDLGFTGIEQPEEFITGAYGNLQGFLGDQANFFALSEVTTDSQLIPTRGADWGDNGIWRQLHQHNWLLSHGQIETVFSQFNSLHFQGTQVLSDLTTAATAQDRADAYFLRAFGMWVILDNYGQVPVRDPELSILENPEVLRGAEAVNQIVSDLNAAIADLPSEGPGIGVVPEGEIHPLSRATKASARYLLAKVLLNKHIYLNTTVDPADMNEIISLVDDIEAEGFGLVDGYFDIFRNDLDNETIFFNQAQVGNRIWNSLHYNSAPEIAGGGWNGFSTLASYYDLFEGDPNTNVLGSGQEERRGYVPTEGTPFTGDAGTSDSGNFPGFESGSNIGFGFLIGQQYEIDGTPLNDRLGNTLNFTRDFVDNSGNENLINNAETTGVRIMKYNPRYGGFTSHEIVFRYADAHLMKAEAIMRSGGDPTAMVNELRVLRGASPLGSVGEQELLDERGRELYIEFWRRNDLIRFGQFTSDWTLKAPQHVGDDSRNLFPIPASQISLNPNLVQNPGY